MTDSTRLTVLGRLTASEDRTLRGTLLPYGVPGYTNRGRVVARPGSVAVPPDLSRLNCSLDHLDDRDDVARFRTVADTPEGLVAEWEVPRTHGGDRLLAEYAAGTRTGVSVELEPWAVRDGVITAATLAGCAFPERPAFPTARLTAELVPDTDSGAGSGDAPAPDPTPAEDTPAEDTPDDDDAAGADDTPQEGSTVTTTTPAPAAAGAPADLHAAATAPRGGNALLAADASAADLFARMAEANRSQDRRLMAALTDVVAANMAGRDVPAYVGELWSGVPYTRRIVPLVNTAALTSFEVRGWRWVQKPVMAPYAGNKTAVPSGPVSTEPVTTTAERLAGAHDVDRRFRDFGDADFFAAYYAAMAESYARLSDAALLTDLVAAANPVTLGAVPTGIGAGWSALVDAALQVTTTGSPTFAVVHRDVWRGMILTPKDQVLEYLTAALNLEDGSLSGFRLIPDTSVLTSGQILVGARQAATYYELGGGAPIRVETLDLANAGVDVGCFGYYATIVHDDDALALADITP